MKDFLSLTRPHSQMCSIRMHILIFLKNNKKQDDKKKAKETKQENRISVENVIGYADFDKSNSE